MMLLTLIHYWLETALTASIFIGVSMLLYVAIGCLKMAWKAVHKD